MVAAAARSKRAMIGINKGDDGALNRGGHRRLRVRSFLTSKAFDGAEAWIQSSVGWVEEHLDETQQYLTALLPSAASAGTGGVLGFRRT